MKTVLKETLVLMAIMVAIGMTSGCSSSRKVSKSEFGEKVEMPCSEDRLMSDKDYIRATSVARSSDLTLSKEKAFLVAQERLASTIESNIRSAVRRYVNERAGGNDFSFAEQMEAMMISSTNLSSSLLTVVCEQTRIEKGGIYTTWLTLEIEREKVLDQAINRQNRERFLKLEEDMQNFREIFEEETNGRNQGRKQRP